jgi:hypothetical protein
MMTFLNPLVLFALAAAALPLLLHLLTLRKLRVVEFSSIRFLKEIQKTSIRRVRFRQILLLVVRTLLIIAIVLVFARPAFRGSWAGLGPGDSPGTMVLIVDDSPSMEARDQQGSSLARAVASACLFLDAAGEHDHIMVLPLSHARDTGMLPPVESPAEARTTVAAIQVSSVSIPFAFAIRRAGSMLESSHDANKEIVVVTDGQATQFSAEGSTTDSLAPLPANDRVFYFASPSGRRENAGITKVSIENRLLAPRQQIRLASSIVSTGVPPGAILRVVYGARTVAQKPLAGHPDEEVSSTFIPQEPGFGWGLVGLDDDGVTADNQRYFALYIPRRLPVLLVGPDRQSTRWAALSLQPGRDSLSAQEFSLTRILEADLGAMSLDSIGVVVLCGIAGPSATDGLRLARFVREGGGLICFPGPSTRPDLMNADLLAPLGLPAYAPQSISLGDSASLTFGTIDKAHPVFEGLFENATRRRGASAIESPRITKALIPRPGERGVTVIGLNGGGSFLADFTCGQGRVMLCAVDAGVTWSDFAVRGIFAPLMHRAVTYCGSTQAQPLSLTAGDEIRFVLPSRIVGDRDVFSLIHPSGSSERVIPEFSPAVASATFRCGVARDRGVYRLTRSRPGQAGPPETMQMAAVNINSGESYLEPISASDLARFWHRAGVPGSQVRVIGNGDSPEETLRTARLGTEVWKLFSVVALLLALVEMLIGRVPKQEGIPANR